MSVRVMTWVWDMDLPATEKLVMLALADCANDEGECWPSIATIVRKTGVSERSVQRSIQTLKNDGHLRRQEVAGRGVRYFFNPRQSVTPATVAPVTQRREPPPQRHPTPATVAPKPSMNHQEPSSSDASHPQGATPAVRPARKLSSVVPAFLPDWMPLPAWQGYLEMRKSIGKAPTPHAINLMIAKLDRWRADGHDPGTILDNATEHNWTGLYEPKETQNANNRNSAGSGNIRAFSKPKDGAIAALDRRLGLDGGSRPDPSYDAGGGEGDCIRAATGARRLFS